MDILKNVLECRKWRSRQSNIAFVPTMGNLHCGHISLIQLAFKKADTVIVSIFVNPLQFSKGEDLHSYPRTLTKDLQILRELNVSAVFIPETNEMYSDPQQCTFVNVPQFSKGLCSDSRPHFFQGVSTIVLKLFNIIQPNYAVFGEKDFQQFCVIKKMVGDLNLPIDIIAGPIVREDNGLAMSSRNLYLSKQERQKASLLYAQLNSIKADIINKKNAVQSLQNSRNLLEKEGITVDYLYYLDEVTFKPLKTYSQRGRIFIACVIGKTRLIDNLSS